MIETRLSCPRPNALAPCARGHARAPRAASALWALSAALTLSANAQQAPSQALEAARQACQGDIQRWCSGVMPGGGRVLACLARNRDSLSPACQQVMPGMPPGGTAAAPRASNAMPPAPQSGAGPSLPAAGGAQPKAGTAPFPQPAQFSDGPAGGAAAGSKAAGPKGPVVQEQQFVVQPIVDDQLGGELLGMIELPQGWLVQSATQWNLQRLDNPFSFAYLVRNPANAEALFFHKMVQRAYVQVPPGSTRTPPTGPQFQPPPAPQWLLAQYVKFLRGSLPDFRFVGQNQFPGLARALNIPADSMPPNAQGEGVRVSYTWEGIPVDEAFFALWFTRTVRPSEMGIAMPAGWSQTTYGLDAVHSFRAPAGTLDRRMPTFAAMARSFRASVEWRKRAQEINQHLGEVARQNFENQERQRAAIWSQFQATVQQQNQFFESQHQKMQQLFAEAGQSDSSIFGDSASGGDGEGKRSAFNKFRDTMLGNDHLKDPMYGETDRPLEYQYHWTDGYGSYRDSNDSNYDPNKVAEETGNWQRMTEAP